MVWYWLQRVHPLVTPDSLGAAPGSPEYARQLAVLRTEATLLHRLDHPNVLHLIGILTTTDDANGDITGLATEVASDALDTFAAAEVREHGSLSIPLLFVVMVQCCRGLVYLHTRTPAVIHRELNANNILVSVTESGSFVVKIGGLGEAKVGALLIPESCYFICTLHMYMFHEHSQ